jgi:hypothetical protein
MRYQMRRSDLISVGDSNGMIADEFECENGFESQIVVEQVGLELVLLQKLQQDDFHRYHGIPVADTVSSSSRERNVAARVSFGNIFGQKVVWIEEIGFLAPNISPSMERVDVEDESCTFWYHETLLDLEVLHGFSENNRTDRCDSQSLLDDTFHVLKFAERLERNFIICRVHFVNLLDESVLNVLMLRQKEKAVSGRCG